MRWSNLTIEQDEQTRLPGYRDGAVVRHFDAPEALDTRFYEVRAKSALNRVPAASQVPFRWTINPYRGCSHACTYCAHPGTPILMADGSHRPIADLSVGDAIVGTERDGAYRRYVETEVTNLWSVVKPAVRVSLDDGTELVSSEDHRYLTNRGWKHVTGGMCGTGRRAYLTTNNELLGTGGFADQPEHDDDYMRGYLCGMVRGDGHIQDRTFLRPDGSVGGTAAFRLALADTQALYRSQVFLTAFGVASREFRFAAGSESRREMMAIRAGSRARVKRIEEVIDWPLAPSDSWRKGFLAGIFDAEGSCSEVSALRIANCDPQMLGWTEASLRHFGFDVARDITKKENGLQYVRFRGGLRERLRFFHLTDPAITRKRTVQGIALKSDAKTRVVSIEPLGIAMRLYDMTTGTGDFVSNGVVSHNCFARPTHKYLGFNADRDFDKEIVVKVNAPEVLRTELAKKSWRGEHVAMGTNTDPYQWVEGRYKLMRGIWEAMRDFANPCSILTKSPLLLRDLDLMKEIAQVTTITANLSIPTMDETWWRKTEPHTPNPRARMEAVAALNEAGIPCGVLVAPLMPGINDAPEQVEEILRLAEEAGATGIGGIALHLRADVKGIFFDWLRSHRPDLLPRYEKLYARGAYAPQAERERLARMVGRGPRWPSDLRGVDEAERRQDAANGARRAGGPRPAPAVRGEVADTQQALF